ncbi:MAG: spiro-SPASM protein [Spirochaetes bacterium]|nr:spiro-SPASM protein [Spirochaetota bacterium]
MSTIAVVNGIDLSSTATRPLAGGPSALQRSLAAAAHLPGAPRVVLLASRGQGGPGSAEPGMAQADRALETGPDIRVVRRDSWTSSDLLSALAEAGSGHDDIFYYFADCPMLDTRVASRMHDSHRRYFAEYTFADGYPTGLTPEILRTEVISRLQSLATGLPGLAGTAPGRDTLFTIIQKDINAFDIETELAPRDQRLLRASLTADCERNARLVEALLGRGAADAEAVMAALDADPGILRTLPAFFNVQVVAACPQSCSFCPYPAAAGDPRKLHGTMPVDRFETLLERIEDFAHDAWVSISLWGEPSLHPDIERLLAAARRRPGIRLLVETCGVGWRPGVLASIASAPGATEPTWIVSLDAATAGVYAGLRGEGFAEATATAGELLALFPHSAHVQAVRMKENEEDLETFYREWKQRTEHVIIQKYDAFAGAIADRRVADLSPLSRFPCWHLRRDVVILLDGTVPLCREDLRADEALGNAFTDDLAGIWERGGRQYARHVQGDLPGICGRCDEYYTFNF